MSASLGPNFYEAPLKPACRDPARNTKFILLREGELHSMIALAQTFYEIALSDTPEDEQIEFEHPQMALNEVTVVTCPAEGVLAGIPSNRVLARDPASCLPDQFFLRIRSLDEKCSQLGLETKEIVFLTMSQTQCSHPFHREIIKNTLLRTQKFSKLSHSNRTEIYCHLH